MTLPVADIPAAEAMASASLIVPIILAALAAGGGLLAWMIRTMVARLMSDLDARFERMERRLGDVERLESEFAQLRAEMPLHYQRREDSIREYTAMNAKLDRIYERIMEARHVQ